MTDKISRIIWIVCGAIVLALFPYFLELFVGHLVTIPIYMFPLLILMGYISFFIAPILYAITLYLIIISEIFKKVIFIIGFIILILNNFYVFLIWDFIHYEINVKSQLLITLNFSGFCVFTILSYIGVKKNFASMHYAAIFILFFMLSWCAFPQILGKSL